MDDFELDVVLRARRISRRLSAGQVPVPIEAYFQFVAEEAGEVVLQYDDSLGEDEAGHTMAVGGKRFVVINGNDRAERQRFTACHELAHIVLALPTDHGDGGTQFARSRTETSCDVFAAELLLPCHLFQPRVADSELELSAIEHLAGEFAASFAATGSRFAAVCDRPCAFVLTQKGKVRYASRSKSFREFGGWVRLGQAVPRESLAARLLKSERVDGPLEVDAGEWLDDWKRGGVLVEDSRHFPRWNQTLSLLWFEDDRVPVAPDNRYADGDDEEAALQPLDGVLPWPGKRRRR